MATNTTKRRDIDTDLEQLFDEIWSELWEK